MRHHPLKALSFSKQLSLTIEGPLSTPRVLRSVLSKDEVEDCDFSSGLEACPNASHDRENSLQYYYGGITRTILGAIIYGRYSSL